MEFAEPERAVAALEPPGDFIQSGPLLADDELRRHPRRDSDETADEIDPRGSDHVEHWRHLPAAAGLKSTLLAPGTRHGRDLCHPRRDLAFVEVVLSSTPRVALPILTGVTGGTGSSASPLMNMSLTWPAKPPQLKHHPSPTP